MLWGVFFLSPSSQPGYPFGRYYERCFATQQQALAWAQAQVQAQKDASMFPPWNGEPRVIEASWKDMQGSLRGTSQSFHAIMRLDPEEDAE